MTDFSLGEDKCILCLNESNECEYIYQPCQVCNMMVCSNCFDSLYKKLKDQQCPQCKNQLTKPKYFFAGKMNILDPSIRRYCFKDESIISEYRKKNKDKFKQNDIIGISKFNNNNLILTPIDKITYQITGPTCIIKSKDAYEIVCDTDTCKCGYNFQHQSISAGTLIDVEEYEDMCDSCTETAECLPSWFINPITPDKHIIKTILNRCKENIEQCDVFSLHINDDTDCYASLREFGIAEELGKTLLIYRSNDYFNIDNYSYNKQLYSILQIKQANVKDSFNEEISREYHQKNIKQFHMFKHRVIESLDKLEKSKRNLYIKCHPHLKCDNYDDYIEYLNDYF